MALRPKQLLFVKEYLKDKNATRAAKAAGYSKKTAGSIGEENLKKPEIKKAVEAGLALQAKKLDISAERVIARIAEIAFENLARDQDVLKACELLGKHFKLFTDVHELGNKDGEPLVIFHTYKNGSEADESGKS